MSFSSHLVGQGLTIRPRLRPQFQARLQSAPVVLVVEVGDLGCRAAVLTAKGLSLTSVSFNDGGRGTIAPAIVPSCRGGGVARPF